jgi:hypothetical protein
MVIGFVLKNTHLLVDDIDPFFQIFLQIFKLLVTDSTNVARTIGVGVGVRVGIVSFCLLLAQFLKFFLKFLDVVLSLRHPLLKVLHVLFVVFEFLAHVRSDIVDIVAAGVFLARLVGG